MSQSSINPVETIGLISTDGVGVSVWVGVIVCVGVIDKVGVTLIVGVTVGVELRVIDGVGDTPYVEPVEISKSGVVHPVVDNTNELNDELPINPA